MPEASLRATAIGLNTVSVSFAVYLTVTLAYKYGVVTYNLNIFPAYSYSFTFAANPPVFRSAENNESNNPSAARIHFNIADKAESASV